MVGGTAAAAKGHGQASDSVGVPGTVAALEVGRSFKQHTHSLDQLKTNRANKSNSGRPIDRCYRNLLVHITWGALAVAFEARLMITIEMEGVPVITLALYNIINHKGAR